MTHKISHLLALFSLLFLPLCGGSSLCAQEQTGEEKVDTTRVKLRGSVVDENQEPIPMVMVRIEGQGIVTTANLEGKYNISFRTAILDEVSQVLEPQLLPLLTQPEAIVA